MIDLTGLPLPENAPPPGSCVRIERPEPGLVELVLDPPHRKMPVLDLALVRDLELAIDKVESDPQLRAIVVRGRSPEVFAAGADIDAIESIEDARLVERLARAGQAVFQRLHRLARRPRRPVRVVAAVGGPVPGGALELALAADRIVACDHPSTRIGLPETKLGIVPAWGGSQRLPRRIGVPAALDMILSGSLVPGKVALRRGIIDRLVAPERFYEVARDVALGRRPCRRRGRGLAGWLVDRNPLALWLIRRSAARHLARRTRGRYPAVEAALELVAFAPLRPLRVGLDDEARHVARLAVSPVTRHLISIFRLTEHAKKAGRLPDGSRPRRFARAGVLGAGVMGGGIASLLARKGVATRLFDVARPSLDRALAEHRARLRKDLRRRRITRAQHDSALDRLDETGELVGFGRVEIVVEAVAERLDVKRDVLGRLAALAPADCVLATNTSSLSVGDIAAQLPSPERVVGMHFFNPVDRMPLVEIVRGERTSEEVVRRVAALALELGKTPVIVRDVAGFLVNRLLGPYLDEALRLFDAGVDPVRIDHALEEFGMPMGPLRLLDEVGIDIAEHAAKSLHRAYGARMTPYPGLAPLVREGHLGKKSGVGIYDHRGKRRELAGHLAALSPPHSDAARSLDDATLAERCLFAMVNEAARCLEEQVVAGPDDLDLAAIFGMGFPPFRGGLLAWADEVGAGRVVERLREFAAAPDVSARAGGPERFEPAPLLLATASQGRPLRPLSRLSPATAGAG